MRFRSLFRQATLLLLIGSAAQQSQAQLEELREQDEFCASAEDFQGCRKFVMAGVPHHAYAKDEVEARAASEDLLRLCPVVDFRACFARVVASQPIWLRARVRMMARAANEERIAAACSKAGLSYGKVRIGMLERQAIECGWGAPQSVNRTTTSRRIREQWVYRDGYLYFENGRLVAIQD